MLTDKIISTIFEKVDYSIDPKVKTLLQSTKVRQEMLKKYGFEAFLDPKRLKFPIINPTTGKIDCKLIYASILHAAVYASKGGSSLNPKEYYVDIKEKAAKLYRENLCSEKLKLTLHKEEVDLLVANDIFDIVKEEYDIILDKTAYIN